MAFGHASRAKAMPQRPVELSQPNKLSRPKFNFKMGVSFRGCLFPWVFIFYLKLSGFFSVGVYFLDPCRLTPNLSYPFVGPTFATFYSTPPPLNCFLLPVNKLHTHS